MRSFWPVVVCLGGIVGCGDLLGMKDSETLPDASRGDVALDVDATQEVARQRDVVGEEVDGTSDADATRNDGDAADSLEAEAADDAEDTRAVAADVDAAETSDDGSGDTTSGDGRGLEVGDVDDAEVSDQGVATFDACSAKPRDCKSALDNDCDGVADNQQECPCELGKTTPCQVTYRIVGQCQAGIRVCEEVEGRRVWSARCYGQVQPAPRNCDSPLDHDCDDVPDNTPDSVCECRTGATEQCSGPVVWNGYPTQIGVCHSGLRVCRDGKWGSCEGYASPRTRNCSSSADNDCDGNPDDRGVTESCNGLDDDCNGKIDDLGACTLGPGRGACSDGGEWVCSGGSASCVALPGVLTRDWHDTPARNGSWDWNCSGFEDKEFPLITEEEACQFSTREECQTHFYQLTYFVSDTSRVEAGCGQTVEYAEPHYCEWRNGACVRVKSGGIGLSESHIQRCR